MAAGGGRRSYSSSVKTRQRQADGVAQHGAIRRENEEDWRRRRQRHCRAARIWRALFADASGEQRGMHMNDRVLTIQCAGV